MPGKDLVPRPIAQPPAVMNIAPPFPERRKMASESGLRAGFRWLHTHRHWTVPVLMPFLALAAGAVTWQVPVTAKAGILAGAWVATVVTALFAPHKWDRPQEVGYAVASALLLAAWLTASAIAGVNVWMLVPLAVLGLAWGIPWWRHKRPRGARKRAARIAKWDTWWQSMCLHWGLGGSSVVDVHEMGVTTKLRIQGIPGRHSIQHVRQVMHLIESGLDGFADIGMVRAEPVKGKPSAFDLFLKRENPLREAVQFDMAMSPKSVHEPLVLGMTETGGWMTTTARRNRFTIGATDTGKSNDLLVGLAQLTGCPDDRQVLIDLKGGRSARPVLRTGAVDYVVTDVPEARMLLLMLVTETECRNKHAYTGDEQLLASVDVPAIHTLIDETYGLTAAENGTGDAECRRLLAILTSQGRAVEMYEWIYTQHGSLETSVGTEQIRANLKLRTVYRVEEARHGQYVIPEYNRLDASKLEEQGTCYVKDGPKSSPEQVRAPHMPHRLLEQITAQNAIYVATRPPLRLYCGGQMSPLGITWQQWWDERWLRLDPAFRKDSPQYAEAVAAHGAPTTEGASVSVPGPSPAPGAPALPASEPGTGDARSAAARIDAELAATHGAAPVLPAGVNLGAVMDRQKDHFAALLEGAPSGGISPTQLQNDSGMSPSWTYQTLRALVDLGIVTQLGRGRYAAVPGKDVRAGLAAIRDTNDQVFREAKQMVNAA